MAQNKLTATAIRNKRKPGMHSDGGGLYLRVTSTGSKSWMFRWRDGKRLRDIGLGPVDCASLRTVGASLTAAREAAAAARAHVHAGRDPKAERERARLALRAESANTLPFAECAAKYIKSHAPSWKSAKHAAQWRSTLKTYAYPEIGHLAARDVETPHVLRILEPIWATKTETATRVRQRIENVLDWAKVQGYRAGENPARWRGHLDKSLPKPGKLRKVKHHAALPVSQMPVFMVELAARQGVSARCLEFTIYTAARTSEATGARWEEIDIKAGIWTVPPERIKADRVHHVPISAPAIRVLLRQQGQDSEFVFPGQKERHPLSNMAMLELLQDEMGKPVTVHGFRSTFKDWARELAKYPDEASELALAHVSTDATRAAYARDELLPMRTRLMRDWAKFCCTKPAANVVPLRRARK